ncbi:MAG: NADH-quinone oxidoreductase subunit M [Caldilineaceae bacterium]|nr:NADH-quinone oxidoreductase subunit M [Caldilineaceae bacterium]MCB9156821.1 NADH-quinone oxidoreductase subunit M [Caldilineaceae bacterium]
MNYLLSLITFLPLVGAIAVLAVPDDRNKKYTALGVTLVTFLISLALWIGWDSSNAGMQFVEDVPWLPQMGLRYHLGVDGISLFLVLLTTFIMIIAVAFSNEHVTERVGPYLALMLALQTAMTGVFVALDMILFFLFFEATLIPMYFLIAEWGGQNRMYAALKFFLYTLAGSATLLIAILAVYFTAGTADIVDLQGVQLPLGLQTWAFFAFAIGLGVKVPIFPFHTWLPDAHVQAPTAGSIILAGVLLKMGTYGFVRFVLPLFPDAALQYGPIIATLAIIGIIYGALVALVQKDIKSLVAYSSVAHLGFVMLGIFALNQQGVSGAVLQMVNHGLSTGALFLMVGMLYERRHTRLLADYGGLWKSVPVFCFFFLVVAMSSAGLPGLNGFVGEFTILLGMFAHSPWFAVAGSLGVILAAWYLLTAFRQMAQGPLTNPANEAANLPDLNVKEMVLLVPLVLLFFIIGLFPNLFLDKINPSVAIIVESHQVGDAHASWFQDAFTFSSGIDEK